MSLYRLVTGDFRETSHPAHTEGYQNFAGMNFIRCPFPSVGNMVW